MSLSSILDWELLDVANSARVSFKLLRNRGVPPGACAEAVAVRFRF